jgi:hypothetical protein
MTIEQIALEELKNVGDDGLFPNHSDGDIWVSGFMAGYNYKAAQDELELWDITLNDGLEDEPFI